LDAIALNTLNMQHRWKFFRRYAGRRFRYERTVVKSQSAWQFKSRAMWCTAFASNTSRI